MKKNGLIVLLSLFLLTALANYSFATTSSTESEATSSSSITYAPSTTNNSSYIDKRMLNWVSIPGGTLMHSPGYGSEPKGWKIFHRTYLQKISMEMLDSVPDIVMRKMFTSTKYFPMPFARLPYNDTPVETIPHSLVENENENKLLGIFTYYPEPDEPEENVIVRLVKEAKRVTMMGRVHIKIKTRGYGKTGGFSLPTSGAASTIGKSDNQMASIAVAPILGTSYAESLDRAIVKIFCYPPDLTDEQKLARAALITPEEEVTEPIFPEGMDPILFDFDEYKIKDSEMHKIQVISDFIKRVWLQLGPNERIVFLGSCSKPGETGYNDVLGAKRASAVFWESTDEKRTGIPREKLRGKVIHLSGGNRQFFFDSDRLNQRVDIAVMNIGTLKKSPPLPPVTIKNKDSKDKEKS